MMTEDEMKYDNKKIPVEKPGEGKVKKRVFKPKIDLKLCNRCRLCIALCPEGCIQLNEEKPVINYSLCTGCLICLRECHMSAISEERE